MASFSCSRWFSWCTKDLAVFVYEQLIWQPAAIAKTQGSLAQSHFNSCHCSATKTHLPRASARPSTQPLPHLHKIGGKMAFVQLKCTVQGGHYTGTGHSITKGGCISSVMEVSLKPPEFSLKCLYTTIPGIRAKFKPVSAGILQDTPRTPDPTCTFCRQCPYCGMLVSVWDCLLGSL